MGQENPKLGRTLILPSEANLIVAPTEIKYGEKHYELLIGIGKDHTASLLISESALEAMQAYKNDVTVDV